MPKVEILITGAKAGPPIGVKADLSNVATYARSQEFTVQSVLVNDYSLSTDPYRMRYNSKSEYREFFKSFMRDSAANYIILYFSGHGSASFDAEAGMTKECLVLSDDRKQWYYGSEITDDINASLPDHRTLYMVVDACHAGGMINLWHLDRRLKSNVVLFAGSNTEILSWDDRDHPGGAFTNAFIASATKGKKLYEIAEEVLEKVFKKDKISPAVRYCRPALCVSTFCQ